MPRNITVTFGDGSTHVYQNAPDTLTPQDVAARAASDFGGRAVTNIDGGNPAPQAAAPAPSLMDSVVGTIKSAASSVADAASSVAGSVGPAISALAHSSETSDSPFAASTLPAPVAAPAPMSHGDMIDAASAGGIPVGPPTPNTKPVIPHTEAVGVDQAAARRHYWDDVPQGTLQAGYNAAAGQAGKTVANLMSTAGEAIDSGDLRTLGRQYQAAADARINRAMQGNEESDAVKTVAGVFSLAPLLAGPAGIGSMVTQAGVDGYSDARQAGDSPGEAVSRGTAMALANYMGLRVQVPGLTGALTKAVSGAPAGQAIAALGHALTTNVGGMEATTALSDIYDKMAPGGLRPNMTADDMLHDIAATAKSATLLTLAVPGVPMAAGHLFHAAHSLAHGDGNAEAARAIDSANPPAAGAPTTSTDNTAAAPPAPVLAGPIGLDTLHDSIDETARTVGLSPKATAALRDAAAQRDPQDAAAFVARAFHRMEANGLTTKAGAPGAFRDALAQRVADQQPEPPPAPKGKPSGKPSAADQLAAIRPLDQTPAPAPETTPADAAPAPAEPAPITPEAMAQANDIAGAAHQAATSPFNDTPEPTDAQKAAGNYKVGRVQLHGLDISIENPQGSTRSGVDPDGKPWQNEMAAHYGYIRGTHASDGDHVDTFIGPNPESKTAYVIDQVDPTTGKFDEPKTILGADSEQQARELYAKNYADGWNGLGAITPLPMDAFKAWVRDGVKSKPLGDISTWKATDERAQPDVAKPADVPSGSGDGGGGPAVASGGDLGQDAAVATGRGIGGDATAPAAGAGTAAAVDARRGADAALKPAPRLLGKAVTDYETPALQKIASMKASSQRARDLATAELSRRAAATPPPAGRAAPSGAAKHPATVQGSRLLSLVSKNLGGLDPAWLGEFSSKQETKRLGADGRPITQWKNPLIPGVGKLFRRGGTQDLESIANMLEEHHYLPPGTVERDPHAAGQQAQDIIRAALNRVEAKTIDEQQAEDEAARNAEADAHYAALDAASAREAEAERQAMFEAHNIDPSAFDRLMTDEDVAHGVPDISDHQALADFLGITPEELDNERRSQEDPGLAGEDRAGPEAGSDAAGAAQPADEARGASTRPPGEGDSEGLTLSAQTPADLKAKAGRESAARTADAAEQKRLANKAAADAQRGDFKLTGSDRAADEAAANGQAPLLSQHTEPFYSHLERSLTGLNMKAGDAGAWRQALKGLQGKGVKAEEIAWSGLDDWLGMQTGKVSKQDVLDYLSRNGVKVAESEHGDLTPESREELAFHKQNVEFARDKERAAIDEALGYARKGGASQVEIMNANLAFAQDRPGDNSPKLERAYELVKRGAPADYDFNKINDAQDELDSALQHEQHAKSTARTTGKFATYVLPGGKNYRELLLTLPPRKAEQYTRANVEALPESDPSASNPGLFWYFKTPDQVFQIAKSRFPEQVDARDYIIREKQPALPIDKNFKGGHWDEPNVLAHVRFDDRVDADGKKVLFIEEVQSDWGQTAKKKGFRADQEAELERLVAQRDAATDDATSEAIQRKINELGNKEPGLPSGPFVGKTEAWLSLAIKRMAKYAVDHGYDRVAFSNGEQNADRYDLSKSIDKLTYANEGDGTFSLMAEKDGRPLRGMSNLIVPEADLESHVGKEVAQRMVNGEGTAIPGGPERELSGLDLKIGGGGMRTFYDKIVPGVAKDVVRKLGGDGLRDVSIGTPDQSADNFNRYKGPQRTLAEVESMYELSRKTGPDILDNPLTGRREGYAINRVANEQALKKVAALMKSGVPFEKAIIDHDVSSGAAELLGGRSEPVPESERRDVYSPQPGFDITDKMRATAADGVPLFKQSGDTVRRGVDPAALRSEVTRIQAGWKDAPPVHVVDDVNGLPKYIQDSLRSMGAEGKTRALLMPGRGSDPGDVYLIASRLKDLPMAQAALFHEVLGHYGIRKVLGSDAVYSAEMYKLRQANPALASEAEAWMQAHGRGAIADRVSRGLSMDQAMKVVRALSTEEALADRAGKGEPIRGLQSLMAKIQAWLRSVGLHSVADRLEKMTQAETAELLARARRSVEIDPSTQTPENSLHHDPASTVLASESDTQGADESNGRSRNADASGTGGTEGGRAPRERVRESVLRSREGRAPRSSEPLLSRSDNVEPEIRQIGDKWAIVRKAKNGGESHDYYDSKAAATAVLAERSARARLEANRAAGAHAAWWVDDRSQLVQSTSQRRLDSATRDQVTQQTLDARRDSVGSPDEASALRQIPSREGFCFKVAAEASAHGIGDMVIGATHAPDGSPIWHAVVMRDGMVYDPTFGRWFKPGVYEGMDFEPKLSLSSNEVQDFIQKSGGFAPDARNQGLGDAPNSPSEAPLLSQHAADDAATPDAPKSHVADALAKVREATTEFASKAKAIRDDALLKTVPMSLGTPETRTIAKDFANADRLASWQWGKFDDVLTKNYDEAQRRDMFNASDEQSVLLQQGKKVGADEGLNSLSPDERKTVETLQGYGDSLLQRARDTGMFEGEGIPSWTPRMAVMVDGRGGFTRPKGAGAETGAKQGRNIVTTASSLKARKYLTSAETEAAMKGKLGDGAQLVRDIRVMPLAMARLEKAIAGRELINQIKAMGDRAGLETVSSSEKDGFFTVDHPAFKTWQATTGEDGTKSWEAKPLYVNKAFEGPLKAVMSETPGSLYSALMALKAKSMGLIMYSPLIHNAVEWGRALPAMPGKVATFRIYFEGNRIKNDPAQMRQAIKDGLVPIGKRGGIQDITGIMEDPSLTPGRSWTAKLIGGALGVANEKVGTAAKKGIDAAGDFWHNTLLWDRVGDLQAGLYGAMREKEIQKGVDPAVAGKLAAHFANRFAGALPNEAMSAGARKVANLLMFSRTFTLGNLGLMKDMVTGLPRDIQAQIRTASGDLAAAAATSRARRIAIASFIVDIGLMYMGNSLMQDAIKKMKGDKTWSEIGRGYAERLHKLLERTGDHPLETLSNPFDVMNSLSSTSENEPGKEDRIRVGTQDDGTAIYVRLPTGKVGEDFKNWITKPLITAKAKESQLVRPLQAIWNNDNGIGQRIYDPDAKGIGGVLTNAGRIAKLFATQMVPTDAIKGAMDWEGGKASTVDKLKVAGPLVGLTFSKGAPGGPEVGEMYDADRKFLGAKMDVMPEVKAAIKAGDDEKAVTLMEGIKMTPAEMNSTLRRLKVPESRLNAGAFRKFSQHASDEDMARMMQLLQGEHPAAAPAPEPAEEAAP